MGKNEEKEAKKEANAAKKDANEEKDVKKDGNAGGRKKKVVKKETGLGMTYKKDENFGEWYSE
ncbi:hypothetical protein Droror1_Dr00002853, partial [Drosera rotundifolia]